MKQRDTLRDQEEKTEISYCVLSHTHHDYISLQAGPSSTSVIEDDDDDDDDEDEDDFATSAGFTSSVNGSSLNTASNARSTSPF